MDYRAIIKKARALVADDPLTAISLLREHIIPHCTDARPVAQAGLILADLDLLSEALEAFRRAEGLDPLCAPIQSQFADLLFTSGRTDEALVHMEKALSLRPTAPRHIMMGSMCARVGDESEAASHYRAALALEPCNDEAILNLGSLLHAARPMEAVELYERLLSSDPSNAEAHARIGFLLSAVPARLAEARAHAERAVRQHPDNPWYWSYLANVLHGLGDRQAALAASERAAALEPSDPFFAALLADRLFAAGRADDGETRFHSALEASDRDPQILYMFARSLHAIGRLAEAREALIECLGKEPETERASRLLAAIDGPTE